MTDDKVNRVFDRIIKSLVDTGCMPRRAEQTARTPADALALDHALWMAQEARTFPEDKLEKKMRWLGFVQGVLWCCGGESIQVLKELNMPDAEKVGDPERP
jgi:hypothetical protein